MVKKDLKGINWIVVIEFNNGKKKLPLTTSNVDIFIKKMKDILRILYFKTKDSIVLIYPDKDIEIKTTFNYFYFNLLFYRYFIKNNIFPKTLNNTTIFPSDFLFNKKFLVDRINVFINECRELEISSAEIKSEIAFILQSLIELSAEAGLHFGHTINLYSLIKLQREIPRLHDIMHLTLDKNDSVYQNEEKLEEVTAEFIKILKENPNCLQPLLLSEIGIKDKQLRECFINIGHKPDLKGNIIKRPINTNFAMGVKHKIDFYNNAIGSRKAIIVNFKAVKSSGYFTRKLLLLLLDISTDTTIEDCKGPHLLSVNVNNAETFNMLLERTFYDPKSKKLRTLTEADKDVIGTTIEIKSPITCALTNGNVCKTCYGKLLAETNNGLRTGILSTLLLTSQLTQNLLSSKHLLRVKTKEIKWDNIIKKIFIINRDSLKFIENANLSMRIKSSDIDMDDNGKYVFQNFTVIHKKKEYESKSPIPLELPMKYYESNEDSMDITINSKDYKGSFRYTVENQEFSKSLKNIIRLLDTSTHLMTKEDILDDSMELYEKVYDKLKNLLIASKINIKSSHIELIVRRLIRKANDRNLLIDFSKHDLEDYEVLRITDAIIHSPSVSLGLSFERIKEQINSPDFFKRDGYSLIDELYE